MEAITEQRVNVCRAWKEIRWSNAREPNVTRITIAPTIKHATTNIASTHAKSEILAPTTPFALFPTTTPNADAPNHYRKATRTPSANRLQETPSLSAGSTVTVQPSWLALETLAKILAPSCRLAQNLQGVTC